MTIFYEAGTMPQLPFQPPSPPPLQVAELNKDVASGTAKDPAAYMVVVGPDHDDGLWNIAQDLNKSFTSKEMRDANTVPELYQKLKGNAIAEHNFKGGTDDGKLPGTYQGDVKTGNTRDLDLIYASDKFSIQLDKPGSVASVPQPPKLEGEDAKVLGGLTPEQKTQWTDFASQNPELVKDPGSRTALLNGYANASVKNQESEYLAFVKTDGFKALNPTNQKKAIELGEKQGYTGASKIVNDAGFKAIGAEAKVPNDASRNAQQVVLERAAGDAVLFKALQDGADQGGDLKWISDEAQRGQAMVYMSLYAGRQGRGYGDYDVNKGEALMGLWNNVLADKQFVEDGKGKLDATAQLDTIQTWVDFGGFEMPYSCPQIWRPDR